MRKGTALFLAAILSVVGVAVAYGAEDLASPGVGDIKQVPSCKYCGMDREKFAQSRTLVEYDDGKTEGFCSIHCAAVDLAVSIDRTPRKISVGDYKTKGLVDAETAVWIVGGSKPGVMSARAKWAFNDEADALSFLKESGGTRATFNDAMKAAYEDMYQDTKAIRERRAMKRKNMQEKMAGEQKEATGHNH